MKILALSLLFAFASAGFYEQNGEILNDRPIVGVFAYPSEFYGTYPEEYFNYVAASYIKWVEQSGARVMPIPYDLTDEELRSMFSKVNALLFPGGFWEIFTDAQNEVGFTELAQGARRMLNIALQANYDGDYFPIYGIQSGMQLICALLSSDGSGSQKLFYDFKMENLANKLQFMRYAKDRMWSGVDSSVIDYTSNNDAQFFFSDSAISVKGFLRSKTLRDIFDITAMSDDDDGQKFVAAIQGKNVPIYGTQFFAQGNTFEWKQNLKLDHHPETIYFNQQLSNFFVQDVRKSKHTYKIPDEMDQLLIYNFQTTKIPNDYFEQIYFFEKGDIQRRLYKTDLFLAKMASTNPNSVGEL